MGLKIPPIPDDWGVGRDCEACHDPGKTPNFVFIRFWDITACPGNPRPPLGRTFICPQHPVFNCHFAGDLDFEGNTWRVTYAMSTLHGGIKVSSINLGCVNLPIASSFNEIGAECAVDFNTNDLTCPVHSGEGGHAHVQVIVPMLIIILSTGASSVPGTGDPGYGFLPLENLLYEVQNVGMDHKLVRLAHRHGKTNVLIYIDDEDIPYPDRIYGVDCEACYAPGKTPKQMYVTFTGIDTCPGKPSVPNDMTFECHQLPETPCQWLGYLAYEGRTWRAAYWSSFPDNGGFFAGSTLVPMAPEGDTAFYGFGDECAVVFDNTFTCIGGKGGENGSCIVSPTP